jgi:hypothetical protein
VTGAGGWRHQSYTGGGKERSRKNEEEDYN